MSYIEKREAFWAENKELRKALQDNDEKLKKAIADHDQEYERLIAYECDKAIATCPLRVELDKEKQRCRGASCAHWELRNPCDKFREHYERLYVTHEGKNFMTIGDKIIGECDENWNLISI